MDPQSRGSHAHKLRAKCTSEVEELKQREIQLHKIRKCFKLLDVLDLKLEERTF